MVLLFWDLSGLLASVPLSLVVLTRLEFVNDFYSGEFAHDWLYHIIRFLSLIGQTS